MRERITVLLCAAMVATAGCGDDSGGTTTEAASSGGDTSASGDSSTSAGTTASTSAMTTTAGTSSGGSSSSTTAGDSGSGDTGAACADQCVPSAPEGWSGPVAVARTPQGMATPGCDTIYPDAALNTLQTDLQPGQHDCGCACDNAAGFDCSITLTRHFANNCNTVASNTWNISGCMQFDPDPFLTSSYRAVSPQVTSTGTCDATPSETIDTPAFGGQLVACGADLPADGCGADEVCAPAPADPFAAGLCIYRSGDEPCPGGLYTERTVAAGGAVDSRSCSSCSCGAPNVTCNPNVQLLGFADQFCGPLPSLEGTAGPVCAPNIPRVNAAFYGGHTATCGAGVGAQPQGSVTLDGAVTVCCMP